MVALGYQGFVNHYCGMSHYPEMTWKSDINKWQIPDTLVTGEAVVNSCTRKWHEKYAQALHNASYNPFLGSVLKCIPWGPMNIGHSVTGTVI